MLTRWKCACVHPYFLFTTEADKAISSLNGRWFGGRVVTAEGYEEEKFEVGDYSD